MADEVLGRVGDVVPVRRVEFVVPSHDLLKQLRVVLVVEWRVATQSAGRERERVTELVTAIHTMYR